MCEKYSKFQLSLLVILRISIGWHFLYEGISKLTNPDWSSHGYLIDSKGIFSGWFNALANNQSFLQIGDFLNIWGLVLIGLGLILGLLSRPAIVSGIILLAMYYLSHPPLIGLKYAIPSEGNYLVINKTLIELFALCVLLVFPTSRHIGIDRLVWGKYKVS